MRCFKRRRMDVRRRIDRRKQLEVRNAAKSVVKQSQNASAMVRNTSYSSIAWLSEVSQGLLATQLSRDLNEMFQNMVDGSATIYDKAMDANAIKGDTYHRLFDGNHTILGAFRSSSDASTDDSIVQEAMGSLLGLFRDGTTPRGLPLANWDRETYSQIADHLRDNFHIPKDWFYDLNSYDAAELIGSSIGVIALALSWNRADTESFSRLVGSMGLSAALSANPLLLVVTIVALAKAFHKAHQSGEYAEFVDGSLKGGIGAGTTIAAVSLVGVASGPTGVALLAGLTAGVLVNMATKNVSFVEIGQIVAQEAVVVADEAKELAGQQKIGQFMADQITVAVGEAKRASEKVKDRYTKRHIASLNVKFWSKQP